MGYFSSDCDGCGHPLLCSRATEEINTWMSQAVAVHANGSIIRGEYDGYGGIGATEYATEGATVWHDACWQAAGSPTDFRGESTSSDDQGWFFEDGAHDMVKPEPRSACDPLREALTLIIEQKSGQCGRTTRPGLGHCFDDGHTADAKYGVDMACPPCIAHAALNGLTIPLGPGRDALAEIPADQLAQE